MEHLQIEVDSLDLGDRTFVVSCGFELSPLIASIQALGLLQPPLVRLRPDGRRQVICGWQRVLALVQLQVDRLPVSQVPTETPPQWCLLASLHDNARGRGFNPWEAAAMIHKLLQLFPAREVQRQHLPLLGLPPSQAILNRYQALYRLEEPWPGLVASQRLTAAAGAHLSQWPPADRQALLPWWQALALSHSNQLALLEYLTLLSRRSGSSPAQWLARPELAGLLSDPALTPRDREAQLLATLRRWCYPRLSEVQARLQENLQALGLWQHPTLRLHHSPAFEAPDWRLEVRFQDRQQLRQQLHRLQDLLDHPAWTDLLDL
jgi:ParB family chromosome partitioning protein